MGKGKELQAVVDVAGNVDPSLGNAIKSAQKSLEGLNIKALAMGAAVGGIAVATGKAVMDAGKYLLDLGTSFDGAADSIRVGTGATGDALDSLLADFDAVYSSVPGSMEDASKAVADFNTRLGLTGPELQELSGQALQVSDMLGDDLGSVIEESSQAFQQWNMSSGEMADGMDWVFKVSQSTGAGFTDLMATTQQFGLQFQELGFSFQDTTAMLGQMDKAGINSQDVLAGMKKSMATMAKQGIDASEGFASYTEKIKDASDMTKATQLAMEVFGAKAGPAMASAIRDGTMDVAALTAELEANSETIGGAAEDTYDFAERLQLMKQNLEIALKPMANTIFDGMNKFMPVLQGLLEKIIPVIGAAVETAMPFVEDFLLGAAGALEDLLPFISQLGSEMLPVFSELVANLLPPLLDLAQQLLPPLMQIITAVLPAFSSLLLSILPMIVQVVNILLPAWVQIVASILPLLTPILDILMNLLQTVIMPLLPPLMQIVQALLPPLMSIIQALLPALLPVLSVLGPIGEVLGVIVGWVAKFVEWVASGLTWVIDLVFGDPKTSGPSEPAGYAAGGFTDGYSIAGEDPRYPTEAVLSFNPAYRSANLAYWARAGKMLGAFDDGGGSLMTGGTRTATMVQVDGITFAPQIIVTGDTDTDDLMAQLEEQEDEFFTKLMEILEGKGYGDFGDDNELYDL